MELNTLVKIQELSSDGLKELLQARAEKKIDFKLIDIREKYEFESGSIVGADMLIPTSVIQQHVDKFKELKDTDVILYCRTGNRTGQIMNALRNIGLTNVTHLSKGIVSFTGETQQDAEIPNASQLF